MSNLVPILLVCAAALTGPGLAQQKLAQTGMKFLNVGTDARSIALGEAATALEGNASSLFFNPAGMARMKSLANVSLGRVEWIADIKHNYASIALSPSEGEYGVIGVMVQAVDYGTLNMTIRSSSDQGYVDLGTFKPSGTMIGLGYARALSDKFAVGGAAKWVRLNLGDGVVAASSNNAMVSNVTSVFAFDFGMAYKTGFKSLEFGMVVRNFSKEARFIDEGFQLPLTFRIGLAMNLLDFTDLDKEMHRFLFTVDAEHPRDFPERVRMGGEYVFMDLLALRAGFVSRADEQKFSYGVGLHKNLADFGLGLDYAYTPFGVFGEVHRFTFQFTWI
jgi:hypothetical protein